MRKYIFILTFFLAGISLVAAQSSYILKKGTAVALSEAGYDKMMDAISTNDEAYFSDLVESQTVIVTGKDVEVYLVDASFFGPSVVRVKGKDLKLYVSSSSLKKY